MENEIDIKIKMLREHFETIIQAYEMRQDDRTKAEREALRIALVANEKRLDGMNEFRQALTDQANTMVTRREVDTTRRESEAATLSLIAKDQQARENLHIKFDTEIKSISGRLEASGRPNWPLMASAVSLFLVMITGIWIVLGLKIDATLNPLSLNLQELKVGRAAGLERLNSLVNDVASSTQADTSSRADRSQLNDRMRIIEVIQGKSTNTLVAMDQKLVEVETQFCASDIVRNLNQSDNMRVLSLLWPKGFPGTTYPLTNTYYPQVCNRASLPVTNEKQ